MRKIPGLASTTFLLVVILCLALFQAVTEGWSDALLAIVSLSLVSIVSVCILLSVRGGIQLLRARNEQSDLSHRRTIRRLVRSLSSGDRQKARRAARLLGELTNYRAAANGTVFPNDGQSPWERWNEWWMENRAPSELKEDQA